MALAPALFDDQFTFVPDTTAFNWHNAYACAMASSLAYAKPDDIAIQAKKWGAQSQFISSNGTQAFVMSTDTLVLVAFRGTETDQIEDVITDLNLELVPGPWEGEVHEGFHDAVQQVWKKIEMTIARFRQNREKSLWFTGHSLGAGLATLGVARFLEEDRAVDGLYTFGQPRTGDRRFAREFDHEFKSCTFRFVNNNDIVTRIPPRSLGYRHVGTFRYFDEPGNYHEDISRWNRFLDRMRGRIEDILEWGTDGVKDHSMTEYLPRVKQQVPRA